MNINTWLKKKKTTTNIYSSILKMPCATDGKSFIYLSLPFKGVYCWANDVSCREIPTDYDDQFRGMSFNFCTDGGCKVSLFNGNFVYIRRGILSIDTSPSKTSYLYPSCRYKGLEIIFDFNELEDAGQEFFSTIGFNPINFLQSLEGRSVQGSLLTIPPENWQIKATNLSEHLIAQNISIEDIRFYLMELFFLITKESSELKNADVGYLSKGQRAIAAQVESIITTNLTKHYTVEELAGQYGISPSSLKKYFSKLFGMPISMYLHQFRMEESARLIKGGQTPIGQIAEKVGYKNQSKFGCAFKEYFGAAPLEYKRLSSLKNL